MPARTPDSTIGRVLRANVERQMRLRGMTYAQLREATGFNRRTYSQLFKTTRSGSLVRRLMTSKKSCGCLRSRITTFLCSLSI